MEKLFESYKVSFSSVQKWVTLLDCIKNASIVIKYSQNYINDNNVYDIESSGKNTEYQILDIWNDPWKFAHQSLIFVIINCCK